MDAYLMLMHMQAGEHHSPDHIQIQRGCHRNPGFLQSYPPLSIGHGGERNLGCTKEVGKVLASVPRCAEIVVA
jgi:hypothetical protein